MFQVIWRQEAVNDLAEIWNHGDSTLRQAITRPLNPSTTRWRKIQSISANQERRESE